ncbi:hypothetical protein NX059_001316 [Plenodomus lindquistii]|nr:hypothetical protein NX059_001316 [Plenodomus lindquistii]
MHTAFLLPLVSLLPSILASPILPSSNPSNTTNFLTPRARPLGQRPNPERNLFGDAKWESASCYFHTQVTQRCEGGQLNTYVYMQPPDNAMQTFKYFDFRPTFGVPNIRYIPGKTQKGPKIWERLSKSYFESTWYGDHMWYSYHGISWPDNDNKQCLKGDWTAGPLTCGKKGTLDWRTYDTDCIFECMF